MERYGQSMDSIGVFLLSEPRTVLAAGGPCVAFLGFAVYWLFQRRWRRLGLLLGASVVLAAAIAVALTWFDSGSLGPGEHYRWDGWYWAWFFGAHGTGLALLVIYGVRAAVRRVLRLVRRRRGTATGAPSVSAG